MGKMAKSKDSGNNGPIDLRSYQIETITFLETAQMNLRQLQSEVQKQLGDIGAFLEKCRNTEISCPIAAEIESRRSENNNMEEEEASVSDKNAEKKPEPTATPAATSPPVAVQQQPKKAGGGRKPKTASVDAAELASNDGDCDNDDGFQTVKPKRKRAPKKVAGDADGEAPPPAAAKKRAKKTTLPADTDESVSDADSVYENYAAAPAKKKQSAAKGPTQPSGKKPPRGAAAIDLHAFLSPNIETGGEVTRNFLALGGKAVKHTVSSSSSSHASSNEE